MKKLKERGKQRKEKMGIETFEKIFMLIVCSGIVFGSICVGSIMWALFRAEDDKVKKAIKGVLSIIIIASLLIVNLFCIYLYGYGRVL